MNVEAFSNYVPQQRGGHTVFSADSVGVLVGVASLSAFYTLNEWMDFGQTYTISLGGGKMLIRY